ncbi:MAG: ABC transporter permease [Solirubrobacterales bacterium]|nr:ABC transporter permease [Solirubrobacterales bacterium]
MEQVLAFALLGLGPGALYAGISLGVVLNYRGCGVINVAMGAIAVLGAYVFYGLRTGGYLFLPPLPFVPARIDLGGPVGVVPALVVAILVCALTGWLLDVVVLRALRNASPLAMLMATLGLMLSIQAVILLRFGASGQSAPSVLANGPGDVVHILGVTVPSDEFELAGIVIVAALALAALYRWTRFGLATRAASENETTAVLAGLPPARLSAINTVLAASLAAALGVLVAPLTQLDSSTIPLAVVPAFGAALLARFTSFSIAAVAGVGMGVIESLVTYLQSRPWFPTTHGAQLPGVSDVIFFAIIVAAMYWRGGALPQRGSLVERRLPKVPRPNRLERPAIVCAVLCVAAFLLFTYDFRQAAINSLIGMVVCLSLVVIIGFVGQVSLLQVGLAGVAAFAVSKLSANAGIGFPLGPLLAIVIAVFVGVAAAASALRVRGVNLAVVTLAAAVALENFVFENPTWGGGFTGSPVGPPHLFSVDLSTQASFPAGGGQLPSPVFGLVCTVGVIAAGLLVASMRRGRLGQQMLAVRSNESAAATAGISVRNVKFLAFGVAAAIAGLAGVLYAYNFGSVSADRFDVINALVFVSFAYVGGITSVTGAVIAGLGVTEGVIGHILEKWLGVPASYQLYVAGLLLMATLIMLPEGIAGGPAPPPPVRVISRLIVGPARARRSRAAIDGTLQRADS